jgi:serine/threonine protein kinase
MNIILSEDKDLTSPILLNKQKSLVITNKLKVSKNTLKLNKLDYIILKANMQNEYNEQIIYPETLKLPFNNISYYGTKKEKLGAGTYGNVYKYINSNNSYAIKFEKHDINEGLNSSFITEITSLVYLGKHPNIVPLLDVTLPNVGQVMELSTGDLKSFDSGLDANIFVSSDLLKNIIYQMVQGVAYIHMLDILHRDIKPQNILVGKFDDNSIRVMLADFGVARNLICSPIKQYKLPAFTLWYRPPEILDDIKEYSFSADIWALGCVIYELIHKKPLFPGDDESSMLELINKKKFTIDDTFGDTDLFNLLINTLQTSPEKRPTALEMLNSPYLLSYKQTFESGPSKSPIPIIDIKCNIKDRLMAKIHPKMEQNKITYPMRSQLIEWIFEVQVKFKLRLNTVFLTIFILDLYLSKKQTNVQKFQLLGCSALLIASKLYEIYGLFISDLKFIADNSFTNNEMRECEIDILQTINFDFITATSYQCLYNISNQQIRNATGQEISKEESDTVKISNGLLVLSSVTPLATLHSSLDIATACLEFSEVFLKEKQSLSETSTKIGQYLLTAKIDRPTMLKIFKRISGIDFSQRMIKDGLTVTPSPLPLLTLLPPPI